MVLPCANRCSRLALGSRFKVRKIRWFAYANRWFLCSTLPGVTCRKTRGAEGTLLLQLLI